MANSVRQQPYLLQSGLWYKIKRRFACRSNKAYIAFLRSLGCSIGEGCIIYSPRNTFIDVTRPYLVDIGHNVYITHGVVILTHGYEWVVLQNIYKRPYGNAAKVKIGDNVFIGMNSIVLKGVSIGSNCIIGAGSVVSSSIPDGMVAVGNPARPIMTIDDFEKRTAARQDKEAKKQALDYCECFGTPPPESAFSKSYFHLFLDRSKPFSTVIQCQLGGYEEEFRRTPKNYDSYSAFLEEALSGSADTERHANNDK